MKRALFKRFMLLVIVIVIIGVLAGCGNSDPSSETSNTNDSTKTAEKEEKKDNYLKTGMYKVGSDIPAGEYFIAAKGMAYFQVTKDSSGSLESITANDNFNSTRYITVEEGQYIELKSAKMISVDKVPKQEPKDGKYSDGMYKVGRDIAAGEYKVISDGGLSYYEVSNNSTGDLFGIIANDNFEGEKYITIEDGNYLKLVGCSLIVK